MFSFSSFCLVVSAGESKNWKCLTIQKLEFLEFCFVFVDFLCFVCDVSVNFKVTIEFPVKVFIKVMCHFNFLFLTLPWPLMTLKRSPLDSQSNFLSKWCATSYGLFPTKVMTVWRWPWPRDRGAVIFNIVITSMTSYIIIRKQNLIIFNRFGENECRRTDRQSIAIKELHFVSPLNNTVDWQKQTRKTIPFSINQSIERDNGSGWATHRYTSK